MCRVVVNAINIIIINEIDTRSIANGSFRFWVRVYVNVNGTSPTHFSIIQNCQSPSPVFGLYNLIMKSILCIDNNIAIRKVFDRIHNRIRQV